VILLDIGLPGMDGWELVKQIKLLPKPPLIIALSGYGREDDRRRPEEAGITIHLVKPADPEVLCALLKQIMLSNSHPTAQQTQPL
jgi:CheY-like chemotaxis protein